MKDFCYLHIVIREQRKDENYSIDLFKGRLKQKNQKNNKIGVNKIYINFPSSLLLLWKMCTLYLAAHHQLSCFLFIFFMLFMSVLIYSWGIFSFHFHFVSSAIIFQINTKINYLLLRKEEEWKKGSQLGIWLM